MPCDAVLPVTQSSLPPRPRQVLSKKTMDKPVGENMNAPNLYGVLTIIAFILSLPFAVYYEGASFASQWAASTAKVGSFWLTRQMALDGLYYYLYNEAPQSSRDTGEEPRGAEGSRGEPGRASTTTGPSTSPPSSTPPRPSPLPHRQVAFIALDQVSPITHSIANTIKRVCIILATVLVFGNKLTPIGAAGSAIAVAGTFLYSVAKSKYK